MTRKNTTSYREKGRAVFLAAIMVLSVVSISVAFTGGAAATAEQVDDYSNSLAGNQVYEGQDFNVTNVRANLETHDGGDFAGIANLSAGDDVNLIEITGTNDDGEPNAGNQIRPIEYRNASDSFSIDTEGLENGEYAISKTVGFSNDHTEPFQVTEQDFSVDFDDDSVDETDNASAVELVSSNRPSPSNYDVTISATGPEDLDAEEIKQLLNIEGDNAENDGSADTGTGASDAIADGEDQQPYGFLDDYSDEDDDYNDDLENDGYVTVDLGAENNVGDDLVNSDDELRLNVSNLEANAGLPDTGEYEFEFIVTDTGETATGSINIGESNEDADFGQGSYVSPAGDIAEFSVETTDTDETYVQIGGEDSDFVEVLRLVADDSDEPMNVDVNTRLLGSSEEDKDDVYDTENVDIIESGVHGNDLTAPDDVVLFENDGTDLTDFNNYVDEIGIGADRSDQLARPPQATDYELIAAGSNDVDNAVFDADPGGDANDQLDSAVLQLTQPEIGDITVHTAPEEDADDTSDVEDLVSAATPRDEVALDDRLVVQVEATGIYGALVAGGYDSENDANWDRLEDGVDTEVMYDLVENNGYNESITFEVVAESATGNQNPLEVALQSEGEDNGNSDTYIVLDEENGQFFLIADTSSDDAFDNGEAPDSETAFTATLEYDADNQDDRYEFGDNNAFSVDDQGLNYPYLLQGETLSSSADLSLAPREVTFDNVNEDEQVQAQASEDAEVSGTTNVAPGSGAELRVSSTDASSSFRLGNDVNITEDGSVSTTFDLSSQEVGDEFGLDYRVGGSSVDTADGVVVEAIGDTDDGEETNETDDGDMDDGEEPADDGETNESTDDGGDDGSTDDGTPGFGAVVALVALIGAALLAVRRQN